MNLLHPCAYGRNHCLGSIFDAQLTNYSTHVAFNCFGADEQKFGHFLVTHAFAQGL